MPLVRSWTTIREETQQNQEFKEPLAIFEALVTHREKCFASREFKWLAFLWKSGSCDRAWRRSFNPQPRLRRWRVARVRWLSSTDGSVVIAHERGVEVVDLEHVGSVHRCPTRNAGFERLRSQHPQVEYVQFIDGDCEVIKGWIQAAAETLDTNPEVVAVCVGGATLRSAVFTTGSAT